MEDIVGIYGSLAELLTTKDQVDPFVEMSTHVITLQGLSIRRREITVCPLVSRYILQGKQDQKLTKIFQLLFLRLYLKDIPPLYLN